jgi:hypothetical protein
VAKYDQLTQGRVTLNGGGKRNGRRSQGESEYVKGLGLKAVRCTCMENTPKLFLGMRQPEQGKESSVIRRRPRGYYQREDVIIIPLAE